MAGGMGRREVLRAAFGAAGLGALLVGYLSPPTSYPVEHFKDGKPCDLDYGFGKQDCEEARLQRR